MEFDAFLHLVAPPGTRAAYLENEDTKALFEILMLLDHLCIEEKIVQPTAGNTSCARGPLNDIPARSTEAKPNNPGKKDLRPRSPSTVLEQLSRSGIQSIHRRVQFSLEKRSGGA